MKAATKTQLETLVRKMDSLSGESYVEAHAETLALVRNILDNAGLSIKLGKRYSSTITRNRLRRVEFMRNGQVVRTYDVADGPAAYVRARAILAEDAR